MSSNYYDVLDISEDSSRSEIREAYRGLVKEYHPDVSNHPDAHIRFQQIKEAYEVLNHQTKQQRYDRLTHDEFVSKYGGYSSDELEQTVETQSTKHNFTGKRSQTEPDSETTTDSNPTDSASKSSSTSKSPNSAEESGSSRSLGRVLLNWIIQGRTSENSGGIVYITRVTIFFLILYAVFEIIGFPTWESISSMILPIGVVLFTRLLYLIGFEQLREGHVRIDNPSTPDAYAAPYPIIIGFGSCVSILLTTLLSLPFIRLFAWAVCLYAWVGTILTVGWGVADDHYNLRFDINPVLWNFAVQAPFLITIMLLNYSAKEQLPELFLLTIAVLPFIVGSLYITTYHPELIAELQQRFNNRTIFSTD
ncbi:hypothetical protein EXE41_17120 [Halorubrum sp. SD690R]|uniref:J domain-containing protein n=1 Tax=Halorubrum sp. SD690R TaxID=2518117 RepID=UPI0010F84D92|nr:DnaJ domain-containing protein [Halorubrum sp. SD690R]TKX42469.1 hypothetical protein EXE41_17120 [Halorubrum sp. SD690R]